MEETNKSFQITLSNNNNIIAHIHNSELQEKFLEFLEFETSNEYLVELYEPENINKIYKLKFATEIFFNDNFEFNHEQINLIDFIRLKKITVRNMDFFEQLVNLPSNLKILNLENSQNYNCIMDNLPLGLKELYLNSKYSLPLDYLPESLEKIYFKCYISYTHNFDNLPNNINELHVNINFIDKINKFPAN